MHNSVLKMYYAMQISSDVPFAEVRAMIMCDLYHPVELICFMHYDYNTFCCDPWSCVLSRFGVKTLLNSYLTG